MSKSASQPAPVRNTTRARPSLNRRSVQSQVAMWEVVAGQAEQQAGQQQVGQARQQEGQQHDMQQQNRDQVVGRGVGEEVVSLLDRVTPPVPGPLLTILNDESGWGEIDRLGVWDCVLSPFSAIEEVPAQHREAWAMAMDKVHRKVWEAEEHGEDLDRALKWWFFLPQALCRKAQRGGRAGVGQIRKRFNCVVNGDYGY